MPTAIILIGGQCAGKSRWAKEHVSGEIVNIDVDDFKAQLPGYEPQRAYMFHAESSMCAKEALQNALLEKKDVIYHHHWSGIMGTYPDDIDELVNLFLQYGYDHPGGIYLSAMEVARERYKQRERITSVGSFEESHRRALREVRTTQAERN